MTRSNQSLSHAGVSSASHFAQLALKRLAERTGAQYVEFATRFPVRDEVTIGALSLFTLMVPTLNATWRIGLTEAVLQFFIHYIGRFVPPSFSTITVLLRPCRWFSFPVQADLLDQYRDALEAHPRAKFALFDYICRFVGRSSCEVTGCQRYVAVSHDLCPTCLLGIHLPSVYVADLKWVCLPAHAVRSVPDPSEFLYS